jgi:spoIIIJ-associated protein
MQPENLKQLVEELTKLLDIEVESVAVSGTHRTVAAVTTKESGRLIGEGGETLRALNIIAKRLAEAKYGEDAASFIIDVNGYQEAQLEKVRNNARVLAQRARLFKHEVELPPMSPYERLVVHELFAEDPEIETQSAGEGKFRHIVLKYRQNAAPSAN